MKRATVEKCDMRTVHSNFNPRPREEGDKVGVSTLNTLQISIHALVKRATTISERTCGCIGISIHALVKRATAVRIALRLRQENFNPRPREEGDFHVPSPTRFPRNISIHALVKRATPARPYHFFGVGNFNPRPREEGDDY